MGERFGHDAAARLLLQAVVADCGRCVERFGDVARLQLVHGTRIMPPDARVTVGLQLYANRRRVALCTECPSQLLHVVAHLMGDHVGLREISRCPEANPQVAEKREVNIRVSRPQRSRTGP